MSRPTRWRARAASALALLLLPVVGRAQSEQYRTPDGRVHLSQRDTGNVARARVDYRVDRTLANALALGAAQAGARMFREAVETYTDALGRWPESALLYRWRGHRRLTLRDFIGARADLVTATELDSALYGAWYHLGVVDFVNGEFGAAAHAFRRALPLAPDAGERAGSTDWLWQSLARSGNTAAADSLLRARPDSIPAGNAYATRLRLYRGEIGPESVIGPADTAGVQRATLAFGVSSWHASRAEIAPALVWLQRAYAASDGWPAFGFIAAEAELAGRTSWALRLDRERFESACVREIAPSAMHREVVSLALLWPARPRPSAAERDAREQVALLVQEVAATYRRRLGAAADGLPAADARFDWRRLDGELDLVIHRSGTITMRIPDREFGRAPTQFEALAEVERAVDETRRAGGGTVFWPSELATDSLVAQLRLTMPSTAKDEGPSETRTLAVRFPLFTVPIPAMQPVAPIMNTGVPHYPDAARREGATGTVVLQFVIDEAGLPRAETLRELWTPDLPRQRGAVARYYDSFRAAVLEAFPRMRFRPATIGGCRVPQLVQQPFVFDLQR